MDLRCDTKRGVKDNSMSLCLQTNEQIDKMWLMHKMEYIFFKKKKEILSYTTT